MALWSQGRMGEGTYTCISCHPSRLILGLTGTGWAAVLGPRGQQLAGGAAYQAGTLLPVASEAGGPLGLWL